MAPRARRWWRVEPRAARGSCGVSDPRGRRTCDRALAYSALIGALYRCHAGRRPAATFQRGRTQREGGPMKVGKEQEWRAARKELVAAERELEEYAERVAKQRQELPWVPVENEYTFATEDGPRSLPEMF